MEPSDEIFRGLLAAAPDALVAVDVRGRVVYANDQVEQLFGWERAALVGQPIERLVPQRFTAGHPDLRRGYASNPSTRPMGAGLDLWARRRDGSEFPAEISLSSFETPDGTIVAAAIRDVTDRLELEADRQRQALAAQREQAHRMESLGQLAGGVAHDFNNLLGVILNYVTLVDRRIDDPDATADLAEIRAAAERAAALTRQLLTFARRDVTHPEPLEVNGIVRDLATMLDRTLGEHIQLRLDLASTPLLTIGDRHQLEQIVLNLAINARDAMASGGQLLITSEAVAGEGSAPSVRLAVTDNGQGMSPDVAARAFEPFFTTKPMGEGTGLGLATVYGIVHRCGGAVTLESAEGAGTTVRVDLPGASSTPVAPSAPPRSVGGAGERILLVEDEPALRTGTARLLTARGYEVVVAANGAEALDLLLGGAPVDVVLSDVAMPEMRGDELARELTVVRPGLPVILVSGYDADCVDAARWVLPKPAPEDDLLRALREALDS
jgi:two-component system cell cycle sensor histidine kinase/response regulator CckA